MEQLIPLIVQLISGAVGGNAVGAALKNIDMSALLKTIAGAIGGVGGGQLASMMGLLTMILGNNAGTGGQVAVNAGASAVGGVVLTAIVGLIKQAMDKSKAA
ncbi:MAG TPA: hypothetical protein VH107_16395 [Lacipirellulaceae bacterium]|jgi:hypothetical protein|nr:hypothetical protein [Lacipirellulaceae bacterium]